MKKLICILLLVCMTTFAAADAVDLSGLSFDELMKLRDQVNAEIISRPEWKEVTVPAGTWIVGEDIPAGTYSISPTSSGGYITITNPNAKDYFSQQIMSEGIRDEEYAVAKIVLKDGYVVEVERGSLIFAPAKGLGF